MKIGFIGAGNMGGALAKAAAKAVAPQDIFVSDKFADKAEALAATLRCRAVAAEQVAEFCDYIF